MKSLRQLTWENLAIGIVGVSLGARAWAWAFPRIGAVLCVIGALLCGNAVYVLVRLRNRHEELQ